MTIGGGYTRNQVASVDKREPGGDWLACFVYDAQRVTQDS